MPRHNLSLPIREARRLYYFSHLFVLKLFPLSALFLSFPSSTLHPLDVAAKIDEWLQSWPLGGPGKAPRLATGPKWPLSFYSEDHSSVCVMVHSTNSQEHLRIHWINDDMHHTF
ncbi:Protein CBG25555 [Caenorhabditis briggsae]|uniref:Protein CBG25555 n=1 Tax=Caenorhabditis briggsae TaxID=6238 RepID=B6IF42_CAEBR|nr:Protein CBG25555 [Caenorhabditis briggsae]CAR98522.1 Protein CBG25555 [Caenorhabditis briggsae]